MFADARFGWSNDRQATIARAEAHIEQALSIDPENSDAYRSLSGVLLLKSRFDEAVEAARKAVKLGPNLPDVLVFASYVLTCAGHPDEGIVLVRAGDDVEPDLSGQLSRPARQYISHRRAWRRRAQGVPGVSRAKSRIRAGRHGDGPCAGRPHGRSAWHGQRADGGAARASPSRPGWTHSSATMSSS